MQARLAEQHLGEPVVAGIGSPYGAPTLELLRLSVPAEAQFVSFVRRATRGALEQAKMADPAVSDMLLAVGEACNNAVLYADGEPSHPICVSIVLLKTDSASGEAVQVDIRNEGVGFARTIDTGSFDMPAVELLCEHGRGLPLMNSLVDQVEFLSDGSDTVVRLTKTLG